VLGDSERSGRTLAEEQLFGYFWLCEGKGRQMRSCATLHFQDFWDAEKLRLYV
jgi:hypothetical protein